jgi:hypothetical protein
MTPLLYVQGVAVAYFMAHLPRSLFPAMNGGDAAVPFCFVFFYIFVRRRRPVERRSRRTNRPKRRQNKHLAEGINLFDAGWIITAGEILYGPRPT